MRLTELKIKLKHLAAEQRIIRQEEHKLKRRAKRIDPAYSDGTRGRVLGELASLQMHRRGTTPTTGVRATIRANHLAYNFLRGKRYKETENHTTTPEWIMKLGVIPEAARVVVRFSGTEMSPKQVQEILLRWMQYDAAQMQDRLFPVKAA